MSNLIINVEFLAGTDVKKAISEAKELANKLDIAYVSFEFNGAKFSIGKNADEHQAYEQWTETKGQPYGIISA